MADDDCGLMLRYAGGDSQAFVTLYARHRGPLYRYLARHVRGRAVADDLFQEVWSRVIAHRADYEPRAKFSTFLYRIAHNCCIDHLRRAAVRRAEQAGDEEPAGEHPSGEGWRPDESWRQARCTPQSDQPDARAEQAELLARYREALERLPAEQRDVFLLYEQLGLSLEEIASVTGVGAETVKSRLRYALAKLRAALAPVAPVALAEPPSGNVPAQAPGVARAARDRPSNAAVMAIAQIAGESGS